MKETVKVASSELNQIKPISTVNKKSTISANYIDSFLNFHGSLLDELVDTRFNGEKHSLHEAYTAFKYKDINLFVIFIIFSLGFVIGTFEIGTLIYVIYIDYSFSASTALFIVTGIMILLLVILTPMMLWFRYHLNSVNIKKQCFNIRPLTIVITNCIPISIVLSQSLLLFGRILSSPCAADANIFQLQGCNPGAVVNMIPQEQLLIMCLCVIDCQVLFKDASQWSIATSWIIVVIVMNAALSVVNSSWAQYVYMNIIICLLFIISYEYERHNLTGFISSVLNDIAFEKTNDNNHSVVRHIVHEIRGPLNTAVVGTDVLKLDLSELKSIIGEVVSKKLMDILDGIHVAIAAAGNYTNELLTFEKLAAGMTKLECVPTSLIDFVQHSMQSFYIVALSKQVDFLLVNNLPLNKMSNIDPVKMAQVLTNFLTNALKFTPAGGRVTVTVELDHADSEFAVISVKDTGVGISLENLALLFQEGIQFDSNRNQKGGGSGFGLYIAKGITELHEGATIQGDSDGPGQGSVFSIRLPVMSSDADHTIKISPAIIPVEQPSLLTPMDPLTILVVDDSKSSRKMFHVMLERLGHTVVEAEDGLEAVAEILRSILNKDNESYLQFDCVLMDSNMPKMNGLEAMKEMKRLGYNGHIIGVTGDESDVESFIAEGANQAFVKPVRLAALTEILRLVPSRNILKVGKTRNAYSNQLIGRVSPHEDDSDSAMIISSNLKDDVKEPFNMFRTKRKNSSFVSNISNISAKLGRKLRWRSSNHSIHPIRGSSYEEKQESILNLSSANFKENHDLQELTCFRRSKEPDLDILLRFKNPVFSTKEAHEEFFEFNAIMGIFDANVMIAFIVLTSLVSLLVLVSHPTNLTPYCFAYVMVGAFCIFSGVVIFNRIVCISSKYSNLLHLTCYRTSWIYHHLQLFENLLFIFASVLAPMYGLLRALGGPCPPGVSWLDQQSCYSVNTVPVELFSFTVLVPLLAIVVVRGADPWTLIPSCILVLILLNVTLQLVNCPYEETYVLLNSMILFVYVSCYGFMANNRRLFIKERTRLEKERQQVSINNHQNKKLVLQLSNAAHDMRSPCMAIGLLIQQQETALLHICEKYKCSSQLCMSLLQQINFNVALMTASTNRSLDFGKLAFGFTLTASPASVDAIAVVKKIVDMHVSDEDEHKCIRIASIPDSIPKLGTTVSIWLKDNVLCIVNNAAKLSASLDEVIVTLKYNVLSQFLEIQVQNSATVNLTGSQLKRLFDRPSFDIDNNFNTSTVGGMGLGMYCLAKRVKALGGDFGARRRDDLLPGTIVWFSVPFPPAFTSDHERSKSFSVLARKSSIAHMNSSSSRSTKFEQNIGTGIQESPNSSLHINTQTSVHISNVSNKNNPTSGLSSLTADFSLDDCHVLVVDDAFSILKVVSQMCKKKGAIVTQAKNGSQAVELFQANSFDLVIMDVQMPILGGCEAATLMRAFESQTNRKRTIIILMSANEERENLLTSGMDCFIPKPFVWSDLVDNLQRITNVFNKKSSVEE